MSKADDDGDAVAPATQVTQAGRRAEWTGIPGQPGGVVNPPVWRASTILYDNVAHLRAARSNSHERWYYGRRGTPTHWALADALTEMEPGAVGTMLFPSGVAAISCALMAVLKPGDQLLMVDSVYDPTRAFCDKVLKPMGIETVYYDPLIGAGIATLMTERTRAVFMESPGSLTFEVQDVPAIVAAAKARDVVTLIDNTWATPLFFSAHGHGVDISILACTKYVTGHSDVMLGSVSANGALWPRIEQMGRLFGQICGADDAWLALRGLRTLGVRLKQHQDSALTVARWLAERPEVGTVLHPALPSCPGHAQWVRDFKGSSGLFSFTLAGAEDAARVRFIDALRHFGIGYSWGGFESLALPVDPQYCRSATIWNTPDPLIRLHIGLEDPNDLIADLELALHQI
ncbi:cystathionine beta-lyase [Sphingobium sp. DEHP117]|uniref:cystathionine beta-lyase n=1 Tax=Sphingobium sp. DEHP117 TaxID=2993436 RepID=UPI0027D6EAB7|nr:cystathionine beta-lyase [Sphingobium sp. DEHP117]MDQ4420412.1 cystathionine beta-lyase [Sphingobium sp. DEHP117]